MAALLLDLSFALMVVWVAWRALSHSDLFVSIILFIAFGLLMSLLWVRLGAADVALAEATIGAGLTGALLLDASGAFPRSASDGAARMGAASDPPGASGPMWVRVSIALLTGATAAALAVVVTRGTGEGGGMAAAAAAGMAGTGLAQPVTAVLVAFRGYDTLLEMAVLLLAAVAMLSARRERDLGAVPLYGGSDRAVKWPVSWLVPILVLTAIHLLLLGTHGAGGGFQGGAVLAATGVLLLLAGFPSITALRGRWLRAALSGGLTLFLVVGVAPAVSGGAILELTSGREDELVLLLEAAMLAATGFTLAALIAGSRPLHRDAAGGDAAAPERGAPR